MTPGQIAEVQSRSTAPRAGNVYLLRGFLGIFSSGIDVLSDKVNAAGVRGRVYQERQWQALADAIARKYKTPGDHEPLILIGHSYGADDVVLIARELEKDDIPVDLIVTLDPTTPPAVPPNVRHVVNLYQPNLFDAMPWLRGIPLKAEEGFAGKLENINIRQHEHLLDPDVNHFNIEKKDKIHQEALRRVLAVCPPREQWAAMRNPELRLPVPASFKQPPEPSAQSSTIGHTSDRKLMSSNP